MKLSKELYTALELVRKLQHYGKAYIVGGVVRDHLLNNTSHDVDIATNVSMETLTTKFQTYDLGKNKTFGVVGIKYQGFTFEVAQFRTEDNYNDGRHPDQVKFVQSLYQDVKRRDFTINALAFDENLNVFDYVKGQQDLQNRVIRTVGEPVQRFSEDYLRMLRALRFAARFNFTIEDNTYKAIVGLKGNITKISVERIWQEIWKAASAPNFVKFIELLYNSGLLEKILPEIKNLENAIHSIETHPEGLNAFTHTLAALKYINSTDSLVNLGVLFHDIGKPNTYAINEFRKPTYFGHDDVGVEVIEKLCSRMKVDIATKEILSFSTKNHMIFAKLPELRRSKAFSLITDNGSKVLELVTKADIMCRGFDSDKKEWESIVKRKAELEILKIKVNWEEMFKKVINGHIVMKVRGISEGQEVGRIVKATREWVLDNNVNLINKNKIIKYMKEI